MRCGNCDKTDGLCYTSNPPKVKCTVTGKFHEYGDECDVFTSIAPTYTLIAPTYTLATNCIVCGESVPLSYEEELSLTHGRHVSSKICDKCKTAIRYVRDNFTGE